MKPPFSYYGGKTSIAARIADMFPPHHHYVEAFAGSLAVLLAKPRARMETVNDLDGNLMHFWRILRDRPGDLQRACALTPHSRAEYYAARDVADTDDDVERARRVWVWLSQARGSGMRTTGWRQYMDPAGSSVSMPGYLAGYVTRMLPAAERLTGVSLECLPALDIIDRYGHSPDVLLYLDPPYLSSTRNSSKYRLEMGLEAQHRELADAVRGIRAAVVLSGYASPLYDQMYGDWHRAEITTATGQGGKWSARTEVLWSNRPLARQASLLDGDTA